MAREQKGRGPKREPKDDLYEDRVVHIARVAKVVKGGRRFSFSALVVVGDSKEKVGFGLGKAGEVPDAIRKGSEQAKKTLLSVPTIEGTIPFEVVGRYGAARVVMHPAKKGKGIIAGGAVRVIMELSGIEDVVCKVHGTKNQQNVVRATINGLEQLVDLEEVAKRRGLDVGELRERIKTRSGGTTSATAPKMEATDIAEAKEAKE